MRKYLLMAGFLGFAMPAAAQQDYPVAVGIGTGFPAGQLNAAYLGMAVVTLTPKGWPVALRLDGVAGYKRQSVRIGVHALSASAVITLRPWRAAPYLIVGSSRTTVDAYEYQRLDGASAWQPTQHATILTGGLGLKMRAGKGTVFGEFRNMGELGVPLTLGVTF